MMKAAYYAGDKKIDVGECVPLPPKNGEVQVKIAYCGICGTDLHLFHGKDGSPHATSSGFRS